MDITPHSNNAVNAGSGQPNNATGAMAISQKPGERLKQVRLAQRRELEDISAQLNLPLPVLLALENDDYQALPQAAFIRGHIRNYAKVLGIDGQPLVTRFSDIYTQDTGLSDQQTFANSPLKPLARLNRARSPRSFAWLRWVLIACIAAALAYAAYYFIHDWRSKRQTVPAVQTDGFVPELAPESLPAPLGVKSKMNSESTSATSQDQLVLDLSKDTILQVRDSMGKTLVDGTQKAGTPVHVSGISPFALTLPDAVAVKRLSLNGEVVDLKPYIVNGRAEFRLSR